MKVICIDASRNETTVTDRGFLKEGEVYLVLCKCAAIGADNVERPGYKLHGQPNENAAFRQDRFIPLSEIDEMELVNQQLETV